jgi:hypothetical protein
VTKTSFLSPKGKMINSVIIKRSFDANGNGVLSVSNADGPERVRVAKDHGESSLGNDRAALRALLVKYEKRSYGVWVGTGNVWVRVFGDNSIDVRLNDLIDFSSED